MRFQDKVVLVTGGTSGIGRAAALAFAREGAAVLIGGRRAPEGQAVVEEIRAAGGEARFVRTDVSKEADVAALVRAAVETWGRIDVAFNNAALEQSPGEITGALAAEVDQLLDVNVKGVIWSLKHEVAAMLAGGGGAIVNTTSGAGHVGLPGAAVYTATKHAVEGLTKAVALEVASRGIRVNAVAPGAIETPMLNRFVAGNDLRATLEAAHPVGRIGTAEEVAEAVLFLADPRASFVTGTSLAVDGGYTAR